MTVAGALLLLSLSLIDRAGDESGSGRRTVTDAVAVEQVSRRPTGIYIYIYMCVCVCVCVCVRGRENKKNNIRIILEI